MFSRSGLPAVSKRGIIPVLLLLVGTCFANAAPQRALPDDNLAYPVLITLGNGSSGSGFFLNTKDAVYLVTAKHVLFDPTTHAPIDPRVSLLSYAKDPTDQTANRLYFNLVSLEQSGSVRIHPTQDVVVIKLFEVFVPPASSTPPIPQPKANPSPQPSTTNSSIPDRPIIPVPGVQINSASKTGFLGVDADQAVKTFDQVLTGNPIIVFGYPSSLALQQLQQLDPNRPLLRKGIVAGVNPSKKAIILDCPVYFGNSGGPVVEVDTDGPLNHFQIIGIVDQYVPFIQTGGSQTFAMQFASNSGYSIAIPMDFVLELVK